jgi:hypothetical protein
VSERLKIGQRVRIQTRGTVEDISDAHGASYGVALDQRDYNPELDHFRFAWFDADELNRPAALSPSDVEALEWLRVQALAIQHDRVKAGSDGFPDPARALAVLDRLLAAGRGK